VHMIGLLALLSLMVPILFADIYHLFVKG